jgi:glutamine synthetase
MGLAMQKMKLWPASEFFYGAALKRDPNDFVSRVFLAEVMLKLGKPARARNPYLCFAALLMAGLDGIKNKIDPGPASDKDLYDLPPEELAAIPTVCGSLREALESLEADHDFLLAGDVFTKGQLEGYMALKWEEVYHYEHTPHPVEYQMYYSC